MKAMMPTEDLIRRRAFELYKERGEAPGHAEEDWEQAKFEVAHLPLHVLHVRPFGVSGRTSPRNNDALCRIISRIRHHRRFANL